ncbi:FAD-binding protein [Streptomyces sp. NPDC093795]|uniref:FAD-binding protein n=1 Tax=Streptomyces sp. NPDC093795 TaxID=3366051 RepID=UPI00381DAFED
MAPPAPSAEHVAPAGPALRHRSSPVIGGGIGGLAAALAVARVGHRVRLVERAVRFGEIGAGLQLAPNASTALEELGVLDAVRRSAVDLRGDACRSRFEHPYSSGSVGSRWVRTAPGPLPTTPGRGAAVAECFRGVR